MKIAVYKLWIKIPHNNVKGFKVRGFLGHIFKDEPVAHHHFRDGLFLYTYPRVQYKVIKDKILILGILDGEKIVKDIFQNISAFNIDNKEYEILSSNIQNEDVILGTSKELLTYQFCTPWLALNIHNYRIYKNLPDWQSKKDFLQKIIVGNIMSMSKGLNYIITSLLTPKIVYIKEHKIQFKDNYMLGITGKFLVNFYLPDYFGLGKSVSRGFGTVINSQ